MVYNPLDYAVKRELRLPLYYTGLTDTAQIRQEEAPARTYQLDRGYAVTVPVEVPARACAWLVIEQGETSTRQGVDTKAGTGPFVVTP
jgi:hypothetical protein